MRKCWLRLALFVFIVCAPLVARAQGAQAGARELVNLQDKTNGAGAQTIGDRWAVLIGISKYECGRNLQFAADDARAMQQTLLTFCGFADDHIVLLCDQDATAMKIRTALGTWLPQHAGPGDLVVIYFSGHGTPDLDPHVNGGVIQKYLVACDAKLDNLYATAIPFQELTGILERCPSERTIVLLDSCFSGSAVPAGAAGLSRTIHRDGVDVGDKLTGRFANELAKAGTGRIVIAACKQDETSWEYPDFGHGAFTQYLLQGLAGKAADDRGRVTGSSLQHYIWDKLDIISRDPNRHSQHSVGLSYLEGGEFVITEKDRHPLNSSGMGRLQILTSPLGADIYIDGDLVGQSPSDRELKTGDHKILIDKQGYKPETYSIYVGAGAIVRKSYGLNVRETKGDLLVLARSGSHVWIDGKDQDVVSASGRCFLRSLDARVHRVRVEAQGFKTTSEVEVAVPDGSAETLKFEQEQALAAQRDAGPADLVLGLHRSVDGHYIWEKDHSEMVFVSGGPFFMGSDEVDASRPMHVEPCPTFWIDKYEVTNAQFAQFVSEMQYKVMGQWKPQDGCENWPAVKITLEDARAYARWAGKVIPTEIQWEKAARGTEHYLYPYGNEYKRRYQNDSAENLKELVPVDRFPEGHSPYGVMNMLGNAAEWCDSRFEAYRGGTGVSKFFGRGFYVVRGGSYQDPQQVASLNVALRMPMFANRGAEDVGFRCATPVNAAQSGQ